MAKDHVAVRLVSDLVDRIDALRKEVSEEWHEATRSDVLRMLITKGIAAYEREKAERAAEKDGTPQI